MTQYMLSVHHDGTEDFESMSQEELQRVFKAVDDFNEQLKAEGHWVFAGGLKPIEDSTVVDGTRAEPVVIDGPFAESKEYLGGFWIIEAADLDAAIELARRGSAACAGKVEVRPFEEA
ncbi:MAG: YciI family protein [Nocardioides sp.]